MVAGGAAVHRLADAHRLPDTVWGKLLPAAAAAALGGLPLGLAHGVKVVRPVQRGQSVSWADVAIDTTTHAYRTRREMETMFAAQREVA